MNLMSSGGKTCAFEAYGTVPLFLNISRLSRSMKISFRYSSSICNELSNSILYVSYVALTFEILTIADQVILAQEDHFFSTFWVRSWLQMAQSLQNWPCYVWYNVL